MTRVRRWCVCRLWQAERQAVNTTVQGSAADIVKVAMIRIDEELSATFVDTRTTHSQRRSNGAHITGTCQRTIDHDCKCDFCAGDINVFCFIVLSHLFSFNFLHFLLNCFFHERLRISGQQKAVGGVAHWLERRSLTGELTQIYA